ncbi:MAG: DMT family transporter [Methylophilaceae bacterium]
MSNNKQQNFYTVFALLLGAFCWGIIWYPYRLMAEAGVSGVVSNFYAYAITIIIGCIIFAKHWRGLLPLPKGFIWLSIAAGWTNLAYVLAVIDGEIMRVMLLFYLSPIWTLLLAHFWLKEKTHFTAYIAIAISIFGAFMMLYDPKLGGLPLPKNTAEWLGLSAGMGFSLSNVLTRKSQHLSLAAKSFAVWVGVFLMSTLYMLVMNVKLLSPSFFTPTHWGIIGIIALLLIAAVLFVQYGVTRIAATRASILFLFELVVAAIASYFLANEAMRWNEWLGGALIMLAAVFAASQQAEH